MDTASTHGPPRPIEQDALRILTVVHQLGEPGTTPEVRAAVDGERRLQALDHLVREPLDLAYVLMDRVAASPGGAARRAAVAELVRRLVDLPSGERRRGEHRHGKRRRRAELHRFRPASWQRFDDALAFLGCRGLLRVEPLAGHRDLRYLLTERGAEQLERRIYPNETSLKPYLERCKMVRELVADGDSDLARTLRRVGERLEAYRGKEQIAIEDDLFERRFQSTLRETL